MEHLFIFLVVIFGYPSFQANVVAKKAGGFTVDLIHHDSKLSPFYNKSATLLDLSTKDTLRSIARANRFSSSNLLDDIANDIESPVVPDGGGYLMKLSFGSPPVETYAIADTGSDLIWINCGQGSPVFDPAKSSTYQELSCNTNYCQNLERRRCGVSSSNCQFSYSYGDLSQTTGVLANDTITFDTKDGQPGSFPGSVFGCGNNNGRSFTGRRSGIVGLGGGLLSLVSQLGEQKFSYCLLPRTSNSASKLKFGSDSVLSGPGVVSTPFLSDSRGTFYFLSLEGISVGDKRIPTSASSKNIVIDSGSTLTSLEPSFYQEVEDVVKGSIPLNQVSGPDALCYDASLFSGVSGISMVIHFSGADVILKQSNLFRQVSQSLVCLAILPATRGPSVFGNVAQVNFQVQYDLGTKQVSFAPADCSQE